MHIQDQIHARSLNSPSEFWGEQAARLDWAVPPTSTLTLSKSPSGEKKWEWFTGGKISTTHNMLTRHVQSGRANQTAIIWDSPVTNTHNVRITYGQLLEEVQVLAGVLRGMGVEKSSRVLIYMPMIPAALTAILATVHLGAIHSIVFGGFAPAECAKRIASCDPVVIVTASCGIEGGTGGKRRVIPYVPMVRKGVELSGIKKNGGCKMLVWQRKEYIEKLEEDERDYQVAVADVRNRWKSGANTKYRDETQILGYQAEGKTIEGVGRITNKIGSVTSRITSMVTSRKEIPEDQWVPVMDGVPVDSNDPVYLIYTSGTTDLPKGVVRDVGGNAVGLNFQIQHLFGINPGDVIFTASDIGWVVGHSYIFYAPLLCGATTVLFEGKPVGTPSADTFWRMIEEYKVNVLSTAPTALRAIRREDPHSEFFKKRDLRSLRGLFLAGERSEGSIVLEFQRLLDQYCAPGARVIDNWWSSESGSPMTGIALGVPDNTVQIRPGSAGKPLPGWDVRVVGDDGEELPRGQMGNIVLGAPLSPTGFRSLWQDEARFKKGYLDRFNGKWMDTGDAGLIDEEGYVHIMSRTDDIINVAAHRFSTGAIEQVVVSHPMVAECCVVGLPDALKGHVPFAFITLTTDASASPPGEGLLYKEINQLVRDQIGAIASLGGVISGKRIIPKTRSGKSLRRVLRELVENASKGELDKEPAVPATVEDIEVVNIVKQAVKDYFSPVKTAKAKL